MESGIKRLWTRRKSRGLDGHLDPGVQSLRKVQGTDLKGLSLPSPRHSNRPIKTSAGNVSNQSAWLATTTADNSLRPPSSRKVQPTLLGVSRPSTSPSRPGTSGSGSLLSAVNRAADSVNLAEQEYQTSAQKYTRNHIATKPPRYVDIFSLSKPDSPKVYNEDVAERNLDLVRVALDGSEPPLSPSKYQEDVAARNAFPPLPGESNIEVSPSQSRSHRDSKLLFDEARPRTSAVSNPTPIRMTPNGRPTTSDRNAQNSSVSHSRQYSDLSWGSQSQGNALQAANQPTGPDLTHRRNIVPDTFHISKAPSALSNHSPVPPSRQLFGAHVAQAGSHDVFRGENLRNYVLSQSELIHSRSQDRAQPVHASTTKSVDGRDGPQLLDRSIRSPSALSSTSSVKRSINLPHRTIMDLTGEDSEVFSEMSPGSNYSASPVVESSKPDVMPKFQPAIVSQTSKFDTLPHPDPPEGNSGSQRQEDLPSSVEEVVRLAEPPVPIETIPELRTDTVTSASTFSPISTLADVEPRRSVIVDPRLAILEHDLGRHHPEVREEAEHTSESSNHFAPQGTEVVSQDHSGLEPTRGETLLTKPDVQKENDGTEPILESRSSPAEIAEAGGIEQTVMQSDQPPLSETLGSTAIPQSQPNIEMTPDSLHSIDFVEPSRAFGVTTRDFATSPTKAPLESVPEDIEPKPKTKPNPPVNLTTDRSATSHDSGSAKHAVKLVRSTSAYSSTFDEDEFAHKQAEARAALIRLQQSLDENFLTHPISQPAPLPSRTLRHHSSLSDGKPVAPSSIFSQVRNTSPSPADYRLSVGTSTSSEDARPLTSYHNLTTIAQTNGLPQIRNSLSSVGSIDHSPLQGKGKQKFEIYPDGPGPSVVDDEHDEKHPLPLPPPLHLNGNALYRNLNQAPVPPSPGEISLSSFPIPVSSPRQSFNPGPGISETTHPQTSHHSHQNSAGTGRILRRQSSQRSQASSASAFSIPYHMIPDRSSSVRDRLVREDND